MDKMASTTILLSGEFQRVDKPSDGILREDTYYFRLGQHPVEHKYPVLPSFDHWRFPHGNIPAPWSSLKTPSAGLSINLQQETVALSRDGTCRISGYLDAVEVAHIVLPASGYWFEYNSVAIYARLSDVPQQIDDDRNLITLRRDLHYLFDQRRFAFIVKQPREDDSLQVVTMSSARKARPSLSVCTTTACLIHSREYQQNSCLHGPSELQSPFIYDLSTSQYSTKDLKAGKIRDAAALFQPYPQSRNPSLRKRTNDEVSKGNADAEMVWSTDDDVSSGEEDYPPRERHRRRCVEWDSSLEEPPELAGSTSSASPPTSQDLLKLAMEEPSPMASDPRDGRKRTLDSSNLVLHLEKG
ncbi:MFS domain-containing protein [Fusarium sp. Ph1]|nr:MFS domain-containing protein [Fusarium sp. Ph1]